MAGTSPDPRQGYGGTDPAGTGGASDASGDGAVPGAAAPGFARFLESVRGSGSAGSDPRTALGSLQDRLHAMTEAFAEVQSRTFEGSAGDDQVVATVDGRGGITSVDISPYAMRDLSAAELGPAAAEAIRVARQSASEALRASLGDLVDVEAGSSPRPADPREVLRQAREDVGWNA